MKTFKQLMTEVRNAELAFDKMEINAIQKLSRKYSMGMEKETKSILTLTSALDDGTYYTIYKEVYNKDQGLGFYRLVTGSNDAPYEQDLYSGTLWGQLLQKLEKEVR